MGDIVLGGANIVDTVQNLGVVPQFVSDPVGTLAATGARYGLNYIRNHPERIVDVVAGPVRLLRRGLRSFETSESREGFRRAARTAEVAQGEAMSGRSAKRLRVARIAPAVVSLPRPAYRRRSYGRKKYLSGPRRARKLPRSGPATFSPTTYCPPLRQGGNIFTKLKTGCSSTFALTGGANVATVKTLSLNDLSDPGGDLGAVRPKGATEYEAMYLKYRVHMTKVKFIAIHNTGNELFAVIHTRQGDTAVPQEGTTWSTLVHSAKKQGGVISFGSAYHKGIVGQHGFRRVFSPHRILNVSKHDYNHDPQYAIAAAGAPGDGYRARLDICMIAGDLAATPTITYVLELTHYVEFLQMKTAL